MIDDTPGKTGRASVPDFAAAAGRFPAHPRSRQRSEQVGLVTTLESAGGIRLAGPRAYRENLSLQEAARFVITDSGGIQEEASFLWVLCLTLRPGTERPVTVELGYQHAGARQSGGRRTAGGGCSGGPLQEGTAHSRLGRSRQPAPGGRVEPGLGRRRGILTTRRRCLLLFLLP